MNQGVRGEAYSSKALIRSGPPEIKDAALDMLITSSSSEAVRGLAPVRSSSISSHISPYLPISPHISACALVVEPARKDAARVCCGRALGAAGLGVAEKDLTKALRQSVK